MTLARFASAIRSVSVPRRCGNAAAQGTRQGTYEIAEIREPRAAIGVVPQKARDAFSEIDRSTDAIDPRDADVGVAASRFDLVAAEVDVIDGEVDLPARDVEHCAGGVDVIVVEGNVAAGDADGVGREVDVEAGELEA